MHRRWTQSRMTKYRQVVWTLDDEDEAAMHQIDPNRPVFDQAHGPQRS